MRLGRPALAALLVAVALPAAAYVLPPAAVLKKVGERRTALAVTAVEASGTLELRGAALAHLGALAPPGAPPSPSPPASW